MSGLIPIEDPGDPRIAVFRDVRERDIVGREGFIAEGTVVLDHFLASERFRPTALLVLRNRLDGLRDRLLQVPRDVPVYVAERPVIDAIAGFPMHRGVLAHGERRAPVEDAALLPRLAASGGLVLLAVGIANHDNVGAIFRNAAAFGVSAVLLDETACDPLYRKALRVSVGTVLSLPWSRGGTAEAHAATLAGLGFRCLALTPRGATPLGSLERGDGAVALFLGAEGPGLPGPVMSGMETLRIEMAPGLDSLNVATAAAVALHHLYSRAPPA
ncbi:TrmH family RNA methyltransferase [Mangrovibrevibacter kandeliae]|uniref:TrmH family RNA methyltransferase n=1 Tax=Mangrovibrevibacter kandeliae TaxID=2968473 RepID=UPI002117F971|nr:RNA methyltransferase [Aurantimonas sp. CSK15Z-1]MCQ8784183.1 RNA methyltransferase [Aurantimonas sp. CSK15Z-1]MCQ8784256.1 RNA methyltransferase [Aurantimonas sp. CSK15Z-1]